MDLKKPVFVIHKHHATKLHYDIRLEVEGTLKSWALYSLPLNPDKPQKAVQVPDHAFWYRHFEGVIPEGKYGAGPVMIWDKGLYTNFTRDYSGNIIPMEDCIKNGFALVWLEGHKLKGGYILIRVTKKQDWIFKKQIDQYANITKTKNWNRSVKSNKTLYQINKQSK